jgi:hypothetical protein
VFRITRGTPGLVRKAGGKWKPYRATKSQVFASAIPHRGGYLTFDLGGWQFMALRKHVEGDDLRPGVGTFNKCILGRNGRGANRRRALRRRR